MFALVWRLRFKNGFAIPPTPSTGPKQVSKGGLAVFALVWRLRLKNGFAHSADPFNGAQAIFKGWAGNVRLRMASSI